MSIKDQIRAEIMRRIKFHYKEGIIVNTDRIDEDEIILSFLDSIPEQPVEGLEEEIKRMVYDVVYDLDGPAIMGTSEYLSVEDIAYIARHFAEWGAEHLKR